MTSMTLLDLTLLFNEFCLGTLVRLEAVHNRFPHKIEKIDPSSSFLLPPS